MKVVFVSAPYSAESETGTDMLTLRKVGNSYQIVAHQCIEGDNGTERYYG